MIVFLEILLAMSVGVGLLQALSARAAIREAGRKRAANRTAPPVTILKPLKGVDDRLLDNLETFCSLDYPKYEIVFCLESRHDPAFRVARRVKERHPEKEISIVVGRERSGLNPKVSNLVPGYRQARYPYVLISDSNVSAGPGYLKEAMSHFRDPGVGMVTHLVRGVSGRTLGARLENGHLNTFILGSMCLLDRVFRMPCVVGKSMLMRKADLDRLGGLGAVKDLLAEDYVLGTMFHRAGMRVVVSGAAVDTVNVYRGTREFLSRHARWNRMRFCVAGPAYLAEILSNPVSLSFLLLAATGGSPRGWGVLGATALLKVILDACMHRLLGVKDAMRLALLGPARDILAAALWFSGFFARNVAWRGHTLRITRGSRLVPLGARATGREAGAPGRGAEFPPGSGDAPAEAIA